MTTEVIEKRGGEAGSRVTTFIVHAGGETRVLKASEHDEVIVILERAGCGPLEEGVFVFLGESDSALVEAIEIEDGEDDHEPVGHHEKPSHRGHGGGIVHIHCHKCRRVKTGVTYNGVDKHHKFSPAATIETVRRCRL